MNLANVSINDFLTNTAIAYTLLVIGFVLLGYVIIKTSPPKKRSR